MGSLVMPRRQVEVMMHDEVTRASATLDDMQDASCPRDSTPSTLDSTEGMDSSSLDEGASHGRREKTSVENWRKRRWLQAERGVASESRRLCEMVDSVENKEGGGFFVKRSLIGGHLHGGRRDCHTFHSDKTGHLQLRGRRPRKPLRSRLESQGNSDVSLAAEQFCRECHQATQGTRRTFPKLSYYVDAVMKMEVGGGKHAAIVEDEQRMVFVKTPDGLTKVIFSSGAAMPREVETEDENDAMPASLVRKSTVIDERTNQQQQHHHQSDIPIAHPVKETTCFQEEKLQEKTETILASRVILPGLKAPPPISCGGSSLMSVTGNGVAPMTQVPVQSRVIGKHGYVFEHPMASPSEKRWVHGRSDTSTAPMAVMPSLSRPHPLARFGSGVSMPSCETTPMRAAKSMRMDPTGMSVEPPRSAFQGSSYGKNLVYPSLRPPRLEVESQGTGGYFVPSVSECLKEGVKPHVPFVRAAPDAPVNTSPSNSVALLMNMLGHFNKTGVPRPPFVRGDASCMEQHNGQS